ncbi:MAG: flagellar M-ring protein FliF [Proteobacteria bacterium]|nr:flagellar M-ring protein FliF [Pseudomonadota bacterium]
MNQFFEQLQTFYTRLTPLQKTSIPIVLILSIALTVGFLFWAGQEAYTPVFSSTDPSRLKTASAALDEAGISYVISDDGTQIMTTSVNIGQARIIAASTNAVTGMEVLVQSGIELGSSPQHERWVYVALLQGELTKTINSLEEVSASRVHIVEPEDSPFLTRESSGSASVVLRLHPGMALSSLQVEGISSLVAGAIKGLNPNQVIIVDESGKLLSGPASEEDEIISSSNSLIELKQRQEARYRSTIISHLGKILGSPQHVSVAVSVDLERESKESSKTEYDPKSQVTVSEKISESSSTNEPAVGIPGSESNLPEQTPTSDEGGQKNDKFQAATNYDYTRVMERSVLPPGSTNNISVSVAVNSLRLEEIASNSAGATTVDDLKSQIEESVRHAIGFNSTRGDQASISFIPFAAMSSEQLVTSSINWDTYLPYGLMLVAILLFFFVLVRPIVNSVTNAFSDAGEEDPYAGLSEEEVALLKTESEDSNSEFNQRLRRMIDGFEAIDAKEINRLVEREGDASAEVLRRWLRAS